MLRTLVRVLLSDPTGMMTDMITLTGADLARSRDYVHQNGRPIDRARFAFHFDGGSAAAVLTALAEYQNPDGGFGHGLEPDMHTPASSVVATALAGAIFREVNAPADEPMVGRAFGYLMGTYDAQRRRWPIVPPDVEAAPHAPWWNYAETEQTFHGFELNPMAAVVAALHDYPDLVPADFLAGVTATVLERLDAGRTSIAVDEFRAVVALGQTGRLPDTQRARVRALTLEQVERSVEFDEARWGEYRLQPLDVLPSPQVFLAPAIPAGVVERNLDHWVGQHQPDGSWPLTWSWAEVDEKAWARAERDGKCVVLIERLETLRAHGRLRAGTDGSEEP
jgi:hypothetical protein